MAPACTEIKSSLDSSAHTGMIKAGEALESFLGEISWGRPLVWVSAHAVD